MNTYEKLAKLRKLYPDDIERIEADGRRLNELLVMQEFSAQPAVRSLIDQCRRDILFARKTLATNRQMTESERAECWLIIDARAWFLNLVTKDFASEMEQLDKELDAELAQ